MGFLISSSCPSFNSISSVLNDYPILCASLHEDSCGNLSMHVDNQNPVSFIEATCPTRLEDCISLPSQRYSPSFSSPSSPSSSPLNLSYDCSLIPSDLLYPAPMNWSGAALYLQWTRLACGGCFFRLSGFHTIDFQSASTFVSEWGRRACALKASEHEDSPSMKVLHTPHFDRSFLIDGIEEAFKSNPLSSCVYSKATEAPKGVAPPTSPSDQPPALVNHIYHFPRSELEAIRSAATPSSSSPSEPIPIISVYDSLYAHMMQVICKASNTVSEDAVMVCQAYNGRRVMGQPHFFGSTAFWLCYPTTFTSVISSLPTTALNVHNSHSSQTKSSLLAFNGYLASFSKYSEIQLSVNVIDYDLHISSWRNCV